VQRTDAEASAPVDDMLSFFILGAIEQKRSQGSTGIQSNDIRLTDRLIVLDAYRQMLWLFWRS
jgi:hypothetical protein